MTVSTLRSFDSDLRDAGGWECLRAVATVGGGETDRIGGGETDLVGDEVAVDDSSAHAELDSEK